MEFKSDEPLIQSYVWFKDKCFYVSTIDRDCSSMQGGRYAETIVWEWDWETRTRGDHVEQGYGICGSIYRHIEFCKLLHTFGEIKDV